MRYCSSCGSPVRSKAIDGFSHFVCDGCGETHYANPRIIVCAAVCWNDKVLMCRRALAPAIGDWAVPSGYLELGETLEEGAARETREETGVIVDPQRLELCSVINMTSIQQVAVIFRIVLDVIPELIPGLECLEVAFLSPQEIPVDQFAWRQTMGDGPERFYQELLSKQFTIQLITLGDTTGAGFRSREYAIASIHDSTPGAPPPKQNAS